MVSVNPKTNTLDLTNLQIVRGDDQEDALRISYYMRNTTLQILWHDTNASPPEWFGTTPRSNKHFLKLRGIYYILFLKYLETKLRRHNRVLIGDIYNHQKPTIVVITVIIKNTKNTL